MPRLNRPARLRFALAASLCNRLVTLPFRHRHIPASVEAYRNPSGCLSHPFRHLCQPPFQPLTHQVPLYLSHLFHHPLHPY